MHVNKLATDFFSDNQLLGLIRRFDDQLQLLKCDDVLTQAHVGNMSMMNKFILHSQNAFNQNAFVNAKWIGDAYKSDLHDFISANEDSKRNYFFSLFAASFRFLAELRLFQDGEPSYEVNAIFKFVEEHITSFPDAARSEITYALFSMPARLVKEVLDHPAFSHLLNLSETVQNSVNLKKEWDEDLNKRTGLVEGLSAKLKELASQYNFVGLVKGFERLRDEKINELKVAYRGLKIIGIPMLLIPALHYSFILFHLEDVKATPQLFLYSLPGLLAIEIFLLYLFRVVLLQYKSVKAQLLQLDLRVSLCQFIESYAEYASKIRKNDMAALTKFEALIFSGLVADENGIPATFDGVEQIASLVKNLRANN